MAIVSTSFATTAPYRRGELARWLLLSLLLIGVIVFHVLSDHEPASARHVLGTPTASTGTAGAGDALAEAGFNSVASPGTVDTADGGTPSGTHHQVSACDVFLNATGGSVLLLLLGWALTGNAPMLRNRRSGRFVSRGPPPLTGRPRLALCVNRT